MTTLESLSWLQLAWIGLAVFLAYVVRGMSGFGAGLIAAPMLAFVLPVHMVIPTTGLLVFVLFCVITVRDRGHVDWRELRLLAAPTVIGVIVSLLVFRLLDNRLLVLMLGGFLLLYAIYMFAVQILGLPRFKCSERWAWPLGFAGSFFDTMFGGGGGTLVVIYMDARGLARMQFRATLAMLWLIEMIARIGGYATAGFYTRDVLILVVGLLPFMALGTLVGERLGNKVRPETFQRILALLLGASGISLIINA
jgi:uncharacterized membrane protein YfcA